jgi:hypothetical protein
LQSETGAKSSSDKRFWFSWCNAVAQTCPNRQQDPLAQYHKPDKVADKVIDIEHRNGIDDCMAQERRAEDCADGAYIGPGSGNKIVHALNDKQGIVHGLVTGALDPWHGLVKATEHADRLEQHPDGYLTRYYKVAKAVRRVGAFGEGRKTMLAVARHVDESWRTPVAPQEGGTRTAFYECDRCPPNLLGNFRVACMGVPGVGRVARTSKTK